MRSTLTRGARRLLVTAGVMTLGLSVVTPGTVLAGNGNGTPQGGPDAEVETPVLEERQIWICHGTGSVANPWELAHVNEGALAAHLAHDDVEVDAAGLAAMGEIAALMEIDPADPSSWNRMSDDEVAGFLAVTCDLIPEDAEEIEDDLTNDDLTEDDDQTDDGDQSDDQGDDDQGDDGTNDDDGKDDATDDEPVVEVEDEVIVPVTPADPAGPQMPATPAQPETPRTPQPVVISHDEVDRPVEVPVVHTPKTSENEVLGVTTTRVPTAVAAPSLQTLPRTGADHTTVLAIAGGALFAAGAALELLSRRTAAHAGGQLSA